MSIENELIQLGETKNLIKNAIINKGVEVDSTTPFREYADKIAEISGGGSKEINGAIAATPNPWDSPLNITDDLVASNFTQSGYIVAKPLDITYTNSMEINIKFRVNTSDLGGSTILGFRKGDFSNTYNRYGLILYLTNPSMLGLVISGENNPNDWSVALSSSQNKIVANVWYWCRIKHQNNIYSLELSTDGINYDTIATVNNSEHMYSDIKYPLFGIDYYTNYQLQLHGAIDFKETNIKLDGKLYYNGVK